MKPPSPPLGGLRVLDLSRLLPGPLTTMMLGDLGADVIKVEDPGAPDPTRFLPPQRDGIGAMYLGLNRSKRSLAVNLKHPRGRELFLNLMVSTDVVVEGFRPGVMDRLGLGYDTLKQARPDIILCSISGYGQTGPDRLSPGHDINYCAKAGILAVTGHRGDPPSLAGVQVADVVGGAWQALAAIMAALYQRKCGGFGQWLDVSMADGALTAMALPLSASLAGDQAPARGEGELTGGLPGYGVFATSDGKHLALGALEPHFFDELCDALDLPHLKGRGICSGEEAEAVRNELARTLATRTRAEWTTFLKSRGACVEPVLEPDEVAQDPQYAARDMFFELPHPTLGNIAQFACPLKLAHAPRPSRPPPSLGEHTAEILLGCDVKESEIESLREAGIIGTSSPEAVGQGQQ